LNLKVKSNLLGSGIDMSICFLNLKVKSNLLGIMQVLRRAALPCVKPAHIMMDARAPVGTKVEETRTGALLTPDEALALLLQQTAQPSARQARPDAAGGLARRRGRRAHLSPIAGRRAHLSPICAEEDVRRLRQTLEQAHHRAVEAHKCVPLTRYNVHEQHAHGEDAQNSPTSGGTVVLERWLTAARQNLPKSSEIASIQSDAALLDSENGWDECDIDLGRPWEDCWSPFGTKDCEDVCRQGPTECFIRARSDLTVGSHESRSSVVSAVSSVDSQPVVQRRLHPY